MDEGFGATGHDPLAVTGAGHVLGASCDPAPFLKVRKNRKFMGTQDELAVTAVGEALTQAGLSSSPLGERVGLYLAVGYIPFERSHVDLLLESSLSADRRVSMRRFSTDAFGALSPLLTFRCLSNMPAFHVSMNFELEGPYFVTYPGPGQFYLALEEAVAALSSGRIDVALVGGVAHQRNFLVEHHFSRLEPPVGAEHLEDGAGCLVLETLTRAGSRARGLLAGLEVSYRPHHPFEESWALIDEVRGASLPERELGPASLPVLVSSNLGRGFSHRLESRDGISARSAWGPP